LTQILFVFLCEMLHCAHFKLRQEKKISS